MKYIIGFFIFIIVLFVYTHIYYNLKTSSDLEVYEISNVSKEKLEEICDCRQPILIELSVDDIINQCNLTEIQKSYGSFDVNIRNINDSDDKTELYIPFTLEGAIELFDKDDKQQYFTENNSDFLKETGIVKSYRYNDGFFRPRLVSNCQYDLICGGKDVITPLRHNLSNRNYFIVTEGSLQIRLIAPDSSKYLYGYNDYENYEFRSPVNPWDVQANYRADFSKFKTLDVTLEPGKVFYLPPYWWYSIKFNQLSSIVVLQYDTYTSVLSIIPTLCIHKLQQLNVKREYITTHTEKNDETKLSENLEVDISGNQQKE
tara:strand:- start:55 stop:1002 length:948 start_codon:yes stop_codon:yes gene_type:complete